jgi:chorismate mutase
VKKVTAASFLIMIFISQVGYYFFYSYRQHQIKEEIKEELFAKIPESSLELIIQEQYGDRIRWEEQDKEFYLDGNLYDVAKVKHENGKTYLYCINDEKEKELLANLSKTVNRNHRNGRSVLKFQFSVYVLNKTEIIPETFSAIPNEFPLLDVSLNTSFKETISPPPKA